MSEQPGEKFEGLLSDFNDSRFINFETVEGKGDVVLTISEVKKLGVGFKFENGQKLKKPQPLLYFTKTDKVLRLNTTNRLTVKRLYGNEPEGLIGKKITIYGDPKVKFGPTTKGGVRIRPEQPNR